MHVEDQPLVKPAEFRRVLGHYPTGVCIVTTVLEAGPVGMTIGSFTSVSLDPPLVGFLPARNSTSWPQIERARRFCVNVLAHDQVALTRRFAASAVDRFSDISHGQSSLGLPVLDGVVAWVDCELHAVLDAGDHLFVLGRVISLKAGRDRTPLLFFQGSFGRFAASNAA